jgi:hypothetical protein
LNSCTNIRVWGLDNRMLALVEEEAVS